MSVLYIGGLSLSTQGDGDVYMYRRTYEFNVKVFCLCKKSIAETDTVFVFHHQCSVHVMTLTVLECNLSHQVGGPWPTSWLLL